MRFIKTQDALINMDLITKYRIVEVTQTRVEIYADTEILFVCDSMSAAEDLLEKIAEFTYNGTGIFNPMVKEGY